MAIRKGFMLVAYDKDDVCQGFVERDDLPYFANGWERVVGQLDNIKSLRKTMELRKIDDDTYKYKIFEIKEIP